MWDAAAVQTIFVLSVLKSLQPSTDASHLLVSYDTSIFTQALKKETGTAAEKQYTGHVC